MAPEKAKQKRKSIPLKRKLELITLIESGQTHTKVADDSGIKRQTVSEIWSNREKLKIKSAQCDLNVKKVRPIEFPEVENALFQWFTVQRDRKIPISGPLLLEKARDFATQLGKENFKASVGWLGNFKARHGIGLRVVSGEAASVNMESVTSWFEERWEPVSTQYAPQDVYNCDELGLFWRLLPDKTLAFKNEVCAGGKLSKERVTVLLCCNLTGSDKLKPFVIGKSAKPRAFKRLHSNQNLPVFYKSNKNAWMTGALFQGWLQELDNKMIIQKRKILLLLDNCPAHPSNVILKNVKLMFLPPNTTSVCQPLDQGIIQNFKLKYRGLLLRKIIAHLDNGEESKTDILDAILMLSRAWSTVTEDCISNCFRKAGFLPKTVSPETADPEVEVGTSEVIPIEAYCRLIGTSDVVTVDEYVTADSELVTSEIPSDEEILALSQQPLPESQKDSESEEDDIETTNLNEPVKFKDYVKSLETIKAWLLQQETPNEKELDSILKLEDLGYRRLESAKKQTQITDYFKSA